MTIKELFERYDSCDMQPVCPYLIAEAGVNHEGDMDIAKRLIEEAKEGGADAIKFQTYKAETLASKHSPAYWDSVKSLLQANMNFSKNTRVFGRRRCMRSKHIATASELRL